MDCGEKDPNLICRQPYCKSCAGKAARAASDGPDLETDPKAQAFLEDFVKQETLVILVHMPTRMNVSKHLELKSVRRWCERSIEALRKTQNQHIPKREFLVIEVRKSGVVRTTSLEKFEKDPLLDKAPDHAE